MEELDFSLKVTQLYIVYSDLRYILTTSKKRPKLVGESFESSEMRNVSSNDVFDHDPCIILLMKFKIFFRILLSATEKKSSSSPPKEFFLSNLPNITITWYPK